MKRKVITILLIVFISASLAWRTLVPTYEKRLTPIKGVFLENVIAGDVKFVSRILGQKELPVENIRLKNVVTGKVEQQKHIHENVQGFVSSN